MLNIAIQNVENVVIDGELLTQAAVKAYEQVATELAECTIRIVGELEGKDLNKAFRKKDEPTNVLSFNYDDHDLDSEILYLGDIVLCFPVVEKESILQGKEIKHHFAHLVVHGVLHLCGYDHEEIADTEKMEQLEIAILAKLNIENPYLSA